jgi:5-(hydroxymethyl)furfural/furfural oxidase
MRMDADILIVGGGSAGSVLAGRLSARGDRRVVLVEAGRDLPPGREPAAIRDIYPIHAAFDPRNHWSGLSAYLQPVPHNAPERPPLVRYEQARIMGGGSSINGQIAVRGTPDDYDRWAELGAAGWGWGDVLPVFRRMERDLDFGGPEHGDSGPLVIHRVPRERWPGFIHAAAQAFTAAGHADIGDLNGRHDDGWFPLPLTNDGENRMSAARAYLDDAARRRPNLRILADTAVRALVFEGGRVAGVEIDRDGVVETLRARETILCAGAIHSPTLLLRAGIGPAMHLKSRGLAVRVDLPGVGENLQEHPLISVSAYIDTGARQGTATRRHCTLGLRYSSGHPGCGPQDMFMTAMSKTFWHAIGRRLGSLVAWVNESFSTGWVRLAGPDPLTMPEVAFNLLGDARDMARMMDAVRRMARLMASPPLAAIAHDPFPSSYGKLARLVARDTLRNRLATIPPALALDGPPALRRFTIRNLITRGVELETLLADDAALADYLTRHVVGNWHASGTCRMGPASDRGAVVDPRDGRVHGIGGLSVVDASLMPAVPRANTNLPTIMIAEKMAAAIDARPAAA